MNALLQMQAVDKRYTGTPVLRRVDFALTPGEFVVLIGGSGSGKTTLLRLVGGLERADGGTIRLRGQAVDAPAAGTWVPPERRGLGMVFQDYALWPHLSCRENVAAAVPRRGGDRGRLAMELLDRVGMARHANKRPAQLSGGEQQRVGIARNLTREFGAGALFVSHDPMDAWRMADRIAVLEHGTLSQTDAPEALYARPATARVARFIGAQGGFSTRVKRTRDTLGVELGGRFHAATVTGVTEGDDAQVFVRPAGICTHSDGVPATLMHCAFEAGTYRAYWRLPDIGVPLCSHEPAPPPRGEARLKIAPEHIFVYPSNGDSANV
ncbi:MAG: ABC transporter ATP-binding protein [Gammaproteobacteria bacterium]